VPKNLAKTSFEIGNRDDVSIELSSDAVS